ncbi:amino acid dehydrogenase [Catenulispora yoronensis]|uniref:Amino acid dehydrogenase n=1 Tax=Catenulispora yoronensis TaxID=450799 RepID=A0ABN2TVK5_9ACTN
MSASLLEHEQIAIRTGRRSGVPIIIAVHSTVLGPAAGGCRMWRYRRWQDGLEDVLRLSAGMTAKFAAAGLARGGGKTVVALPEEMELGPGQRREVLLDVADAIEALGGIYATGPDVGTGPDDMALMGERTNHVFCKPTALGGSGDSSPHTADGTLAALQAVATGLDGTRSLRGLRLAVVGLGNVGARIAAALAQEGAELVLSDIDPGKQALAEQLGARWEAPEAALTAEVDIVVPAALGGVLTDVTVPALRCRAIAGPANNQLATPEVADLLQARGIEWVPDYVASAGGVIHAVSVELDGLGEDDAHKRVLGIEGTVRDLLADAKRRGVSAAVAAEELVRARLGAAARLGGAARFDAAAQLGGAAPSA